MNVAYMVMKEVYPKETEIIDDYWFGPFSGNGNEAMRDELASLGHKKPMIEKLCKIFYDERIGT